MKKSYFVASCSTDSGKTFITSQVCSIINLHSRIRAVKPIITGYSELSHLNDTHILIKANGETISQKQIELTSPWRYSNPVSPHIASGDEQILLSEVITFCQQNIREHQNLIIEGAGGIMSPINHTETFLDLISKLNVPVIFIAPVYLGSISHSLTAISVLRFAGIEISCVVVNESSPNASNGVATLRIIEQFSKAPTFHVRYNGDCTAIADFIANSH